MKGTVALVALLAVGGAVVSMPATAQRTTPVTVENTAGDPVPVTGFVTGLVSPDLASMTPVTVQQRVSADNTPEDRSGDTTQTLALCIGDAPCTLSDNALADRIRSGSVEVLVVTGVSAFNFAPGLPTTDGYGLTNVGACRSGFFPRRFGVPFISVDGRATTQVTFDPGVIISDLNAGERVCFTQLSQGTSKVDVTLHGYLTTRP